MSTPVSYRLRDLAERVGATVRGDGGRVVRGVATLEEAGPDDLTWASDAKFAEQVVASRAGAVLLPRGWGPTPMPALLCENPEHVVLDVLAAFAPPSDLPVAGVHPTAVLAEGAQIGRDVAVGPYAVVGPGVRIGDRTVLAAQVVIGRDVSIGDDCVIWPGCVVRERCQIGSRVVLHPRVVIGADGFGYHFIDGQHRKIPQIGTVQIEDDVEIGAGSCVDRGKTGATVIGRGTKIDNLVQVGHNVRVGPGCILVAQVGIAGSSRLGRHVVLGGKVGIRDHVELGDGVQAAAYCGVSKSFGPGTVINGIPAVENREYLRQQARVRKLGEVLDQLRDLDRRVSQLESSAHDRRAD
jgi:UDP-3-O-[3-hydroxymyristoyl] glucosamine N-acyltransferase